MQSLLTIVAALGLAAETPVFSGPQTGERMVPFKVLGVYDGERGQEFDFVSMAADKPFMMVFIHNPTRPAGDLTRVLLHFAHERKEAGLFASLVYLTDDITEAERKMLQAYGWWNCGPPAGVSVDGAEGPGAYGLNRNVTMTVLVGKADTVNANIALVQPSATDAPRILETVAAMVGGSIPTVPEIEFLSSPSLLPPIEKQWREGKIPTDPQLRAMLCALLRDGADSQYVARQVAAINAYVGENPALQAELGESSRLVLARSYGSRPPIIRHAPQLKEPFSVWEQKFFAPEILVGK